MPTFVPLWPEAQDTVPLFLDGTSPVSAQWINNVQLLAQVLEAELGVDIVTYPNNSLRDVIDKLVYRRDGGLGGLGKMRGLSRLVETGPTHATLGLGTHTLTFNLMTPEDIPQDGVEAYVHLGTVLQPTDIRGGIINGHPQTTTVVLGINFPSDKTTVFYKVFGAWSNGGAMTGTGIPTTHHVIWGLAEFQ